jgi:regulator of sirC expression with transglutaminase-like and TPR domain
MGLSGCDAGDLTIHNVLLDRVVANGVGAPITLSMIYMMVARWAGLTATGVALPNHFLVRIHGPRSLLIDPFHGGRVIPKADCARYLRACGVSPVRDQLRDLVDREVMIHYLRSLWRELPSQQSRCRDQVGHALGHLEATVS